MGQSRVAMGFDITRDDNCSAPLSTDLPYEPIRYLYYGRGDTLKDRRYCGMQADIETR